MDEQENPDSDELAPIIEVAKQKLIKWHEGLVGDMAFGAASEGDSPDAQSIVREAIEAALILKAADRIARTMVYEMSQDNGCKYEPTEEQWKELREAIQVMDGNDCEFTDEDILDLVAGEETERQEKYSKFAGWQRLDNALAAIFNEED